MIRYDPGEAVVTVDVALKLFDRSVDFDAKVYTGSRREVVPPARFQRATFRLEVGLRRVYAGSPRFVGVSKLYHSLTAFFRLALSRLSAAPQSAAESAPGLFVVDEAGRIPIRALTKMLSIAPCSEVAIVVAFQHIGQIYNHYGPHNGDAVLRSFKTMVFLPGLDQRTTEFGARLAGFNAIQRGAIDEGKKKSKDERLARAKRVSTYRMNYANWITASAPSR